MSTSTKLTPAMQEVIDRMASHPAMLMCRVSPYWMLYGQVVPLGTVQALFNRGLIATSTWSGDLYKVLTALDGAHYLTLTDAGRAVAKLVDEPASDAGNEMTMSEGDTSRD